MIRAIACVFVFLFLCHPCGRCQAAGKAQRCSVRVMGHDRVYHIYVPSAYERGSKLPLVIMLHGGGGTAEAVMKETGWTDMAEKNVFIAAFPDALARDPSRPSSFRNNPQAWNDGSGRFSKQNGADDVLFIKLMVEQISSNYGIDSTRVFAAGFSNGASMAFRLGAELSSVFAAIAPVAGALWQDPVRLKEPVSLIYITGTGDTLNPMKGGAPTLANGRLMSANITERPKPPVKENIERWKSALGISGEGKESVNHGGVKAVAYSNDRADIVFYTLEGQGHVWPGGRSCLPESLVGRDVKAMNANEVIWDFFKRHPRAVTGAK